MFSVVKSVSFKIGKVYLPMGGVVPPFLLRERINGQFPDKNFW